MTRCKGMVKETNFIYVLNTNKKTAGLLRLSFSKPIFLLTKTVFTQLKKADKIKFISEAAVFRLLFLHRKQYDTCTSRMDRRLHSMPFDTADLFRQRC